MNKKIYRFGVIKFSDRISRSPGMHKRFMKSLKLNGYYDAFSIEPDGLSSFIGKVKNGLLDGFNVTIPHKESLYHLCDELTPEAEAVRAVNTVRVVGDKLTGHNTDIGGFSRAIAENFRDLKIDNALIIGAGGAARAVAYALAKQGVSDIYIKNRTILRAQSLSDDLKHLFPGTKFHVIGGGAANPGDIHLAICTLKPGVINQKMISSIKGLKYYYDVNYTPDAISLASEIKQTGIQTATGLNMLVYQGIESLGFWLGHKIEDDKLVNNVITELTMEKV